jgi:hypothetical protein
MSQCVTAYVVSSTVWSGKMLAVPLLRIDPRESHGTSLIHDTRHVERQTNLQIDLEARALSPSRHTAQRNNLDCKVMTRPQIVLPALMGSVYT